MQHPASFLQIESSWTVEIIVVFSFTTYIHYLYDMHYVLNFTFTCNSSRIYMYSIHMTCISVKFTFYIIRQVRSGLRWHITYICSVELSQHIEYIIHVFLLTANMQIFITYMQVATFLIFMLKYVSYILHDVHVLLYSSFLIFIFDLGLITFHTFCKYFCTDI